MRRRTYIALLILIAVAPAAIALLMPRNNPPCRNLDTGGIVSKLNCKETK